MAHFQGQGFELRALGVNRVQIEVSGGVSFGVGVVARRHRGVELGQDVQVVIVGFGFFCGGGGGGDRRFGLLGEDFADGGVLDEGGEEVLVDAVGFGEGFLLLLVAEGLGKGEKGQNVKICVEE